MHVQMPSVTRVIFNVGDVVDSQQGWSLQVEQVVEDQGVYTYLGTRVDTEESGVALREIFLSNQIRFNKPQDKLFLRSNRSHGQLCAALSRSYQSISTAQKPNAWLVWYARWADPASAVHRP